MRPFACNEAAMASLQCLREIIKERLAAAAEEIFITVCQKTLVYDEEEGGRQCRPLDIPKQQVKLHTELPHQHVCKEEELLVEQQLCNLERISSLHQDDHTESPQIKEEQEELCNSLDQDDSEPPQIKEEQEQLHIREEGEKVSVTEEEQAIEMFMLTLTCEESDNSEDQTLDVSPDETRSAADRENITIVSVTGSLEPEPYQENQLLSPTSHVAERPDPNRSKPGSTKNAESKPQKRRRKSKSHTNNEYNSTTLDIHSNAYTGRHCFECDTCGKTFQYKSTWLSHLRVHTGEKPYPCSTCEKRYSKRCHLIEHMRVHTGEKPYSCSTCEKRFSCTVSLKRHIRIHTGEKPYQCNICEKRFSHLETLKTHMRVHTGEKPFLCNVCEKSFAQQATLNGHMSVHTGEKKYACNICEKRFARLDTLKGHMTVHTGEKPYPCHTCEKRFTNFRRLKYHMKFHMKEGSCTPAVPARKGSLTRAR